MCFGGAFGEEDVLGMREACEGAAKEAVWLLVDETKPRPNIADDPVAYGMHMVGRAKEALGKVLDEGGDVREEWRGRVVGY